MNKVLECDVCNTHWPIGEEYSAGDECPNGCGANPEDIYYDASQNLASYLVEVPL